MGKTTNYKRSQKIKKTRKVAGPMSVITPHMRVFLPYSQQGILTEAAAQLGNAYTFALNSAFDPDFSGGGLQPLGLDQFAQFYGRYRVKNVMVEVTFGARTAGEPINVGMYASAQSTLPAQAVAWRVQPTPTTQYKMIAGATGGSCVQVFKASIDIARVLGVTDQEYQTDMDFQALFTNSPARLAYLHIWVQSITGTVGTVHWAVRLKMDTELSQPVSLSLS